MKEINEKICVDLTNLSFGERLAMLRSVKNKKQVEVSTELGVSYKTLSKWETGETEPAITDLNNIANYYNVTLDFIIKGSTVNNNDVEIAKKIQELNGKIKLTNELNELLKPYGRFSVEEKNKMFKINDKEILVNIEEVVARGDIDLFNKLNEKYKMYIRVKNDFSSCGSSYGNEVEYDKVFNDFPHRLTLDEALSTNKIEFYELALENLNKEQTEIEKRRNQFKEMGYADYMRMAPFDIDIEMRLSETLGKVLSIYPEEDKLLLWLLDNGACILVKEPWTYSEGYHIEKDMINTNLLKKSIKH